MWGDIRAPNATQSSFRATRERYEEGIRMLHFRCYWRCRRKRVGAGLWFVMTLALMIICATCAQARIFFHQTEGNLQSSGVLNVDFEIVKHAKGHPFSTHRICGTTLRGIPVRAADITRGREREKRICRMLETSSDGPSTWKPGFCKKVVQMNTRKERRLSGPGSHPPSCKAKCGRCVPCKPVHVPIPPGRKRPLEYYPEFWRCKCGNKLYMP